MQFNDMLQEMGWKNARADDPLRGRESQRFPGPARPEPAAEIGGQLRLPRAPAAQFVELEHPAVRRLEWIELYSLLTRTGGRDDG